MTSISLESSPDSFAVSVTHKPTCGEETWSLVDPELIKSTGEIKKQKTVAVSPTCCCFYSKWTKGIKTHKYQTPAKQSGGVKSGNSKMCKTLPLKQCFTSFTSRITILVSVHSRFGTRTTKVHSGAGSAWSDRWDWLGHQPVSEDGHSTGGLFLLGQLSLSINTFTHPQDTRTWSDVGDDVTASPSSQSFSPVTATRRQLVARTLFLKSSILYWPVIHLSN